MDPAEVQRMLMALSGRSDQTGSGFGNGQQGSLGNQQIPIDPSMVSRSPTGETPMPIPGQGSPWGASGTDMMNSLMTPAMAPAMQQPDMINALMNQPPPMTPPPTSPY